MTVERAPGIPAPAKLLLAIFDQRGEWEGESLHDALVRVLEAHGIAGATVLSGITGFGAHRGVHRKGLIGLPHDKPAVVLVIENESKLRELIPTLRSMIAEGVVVLLDAECDSGLPDEFLSRTPATRSRTVLSYCDLRRSLARSGARMRTTNVPSRVRSDLKMWPFSWRNVLMQGAGLLRAGARSCFG
jgi:uncharacterized protein